MDYDIVSSIWQHIENIWKRNICKIKCPNLIAPDIVLTHPLSSMSGYVNYIKYVAGSTKGNTTQGDVFNDPFRLGKVDPNYTSSRVVKDYKLTESATEFTMDWKPVIRGTVTVTNGTNTFVDDGKGKLILVSAGDSVARRTVMTQPVDNVANMGDLRLEGVDSYVETVVYNAAGEPVTTAAGTIDYETGKIEIPGGVVNDVQVAYSYNNVNIPQNDIPLLKNLVA